ncbi:MAG: hypothetical protein ACRC41_01195 [Sarcina sp.]
MKIIDILNLISKTSVDFEYGKYYKERYTREEKYTRLLNYFFESLERLRINYLAGNMCGREEEIKVMTEEELQEELQGEYIVYDIVGHIGEYSIEGYSNREEAYMYYNRSESNTFTTEIMIIHNGKVLEYGGYQVRYRGK